MRNLPDYGSRELGPEPRSELRPHGVVAVLREGPRYLLVRRSEQVRAPGFWCFPGGALEPGEDEPQALEREIREELGIRVEAVSRIWRAVTAWGTDLAWWEARWSQVPGNTELRLDPQEIAEVRWLLAGEALALDKLLGSNAPFFEIDARRQGACPDVSSR